MPRGGKREGAGNKSGSRKRFRDGKIAELFGPRMRELGDEFLNSKDPKVRKWAWKELLPYAFARMPQEQHHTGIDGPIQVTLIQK